MMADTYTFRVGPLPFNEALALVRQTEWAAHMPESDYKTALDNSLCVGGYDRDGRLIAMARLITDRVIFAYLADVVVTEELRGQSIGKAMMAFITGLDMVKSLRRFYLVNGDLQPFYRSFGFERVPDPERHMQIFRPKDQRQDAE